MREATERRSPEVPEVHPCLWMSAGLVSYKLCDRAFDCERCPFDAALRGEPAGTVATAEWAGDALAPRPPFVFPDDRRYGASHTWAQFREAGESEGGVARFGLDAFAMSLAAPVRRLRSRTPEGKATAAGATVGELDLDGGTLPVATPVAGLVERWNPLWDESPRPGGGGPLTASPYGDGWIAELVPADPGELEGLAPAGIARERSLLDLRRFRRRAALHLLAADAASPGYTLPDGGQVLTDLRAILGPRRYVELLRELQASPDVSPGCEAKRCRCP